MSDPSTEEFSGPDGRPRGGVRRATRWNAAGKGAVIAVRWFVRMWLLILVPIEDLGVVAVAVSISGFLTYFSDFGTGQSVVQRKQLDAGFLSTVFWSNAALGAVLSGGLWLGCLGWDALAGPARVTEILPVLGLSFALLSLGIVQRNLLARRLEFGKVALVHLAEAVSYGVTAVLLARAGHGVWALVNGTLAGAAGSVIASWVLGAWRPRFEFHLRVLREIWSFSTNLLAAQITTYAFQQADRFIIYGLLGPLATGYYYAAQQLVLYPIRQLTQVLVGVLVPALSRLQDDLPQLRDRLLRALAGIALVIAPCLFGLAAVMDPLVRGFLRDPESLEDKWGPAVVPALLMIPASLLRSILASTGSVYVSQGQTRLMFRWSFRQGLSIVTAYFVGAVWGLSGVAAGFSLVHILLAPWLFGVPLGLVGLRLKDAVRALAPPVGLALGMGGLVYATQWMLANEGAGDVPRTLVGVALGVVLYGGAVLVWQPLGTRDFLKLVGLGRLDRRAAA